MIKKALAISLSFLLMLLFLTSCGGNKEQKVTCSMCSGTGQVKYYYGNGDSDYNWGPCTSCDEKGYIMVVPSGNSNGGKKPICNSCEKYVEELITKEDKAGESRSWCADCWNNYDDMMGK